MPAVESNHLEKAKSIQVSFIEYELREKIGLRSRVVAKVQLSALTFLRELC
jgi:hypothetical protein